MITMTTITIGWRPSSLDRRAVASLRNDRGRDPLLRRDARTVSSSSMTIETTEQYEAAIERLKALGENPSEGPDEDEFFEISAAMVEYETSRAAGKGANP